MITIWFNISNIVCKLRLWQPCTCWFVCIAHLLAFVLCFASCIIHYLPMLIYIIKGDMFVCLFVCIYVPYGLPNGWADRDQTWHTHSCPPRECFWQGQCQGHSCMRAGVTELPNTRKATPGERCSNYVRRTGEATSGERLRNSVRTTDNYSSSNEARRRRRRAASGGASRTPSGGRVTTASN